MITEQPQQLDKSGQRITIPNGSTLLYSEDCGREHQAPTVVERGDKIGVSDRYLAACLILLGYDTISDTPTFCGNRAWFWFEEWPDQRIRRVAAEWYSNWRKDTAKVSFAHALIKLGKSIGCRCKELQAQQIFGTPANIRKL